MIRHKFSPGDCSNRAFFGPLMLSVFFFVAAFVETILEGSAFSDVLPARSGILEHGSGPSAFVSVLQV